MADSDINEDHNSEKLLWPDENGLKDVSNENVVGNVTDAINNNNVIIDRESERCVTMKKRMGLMTGVALIVGTMIGNNKIVNTVTLGKAENHKY